jgi:hypothetical protein
MIQSDRTLPCTLRKQELHASNCPLTITSIGLVRIIYFVIEHCRVIIVVSIVQVTVLLVLTVLAG